MPKPIQLTKGYIAWVDDEDYDRVARYSWFAQVIKGKVYAATHRKGILFKKYVYMHRYILGDPKDIEVDHWNNDGLDNRRCNLRQVTHAQQQFNRPKKSGTSSKYKGVCWNTLKSRWMAGIKVNQKRIHLGLFEVEEDAARAYDNAALEYFGEFALLNFPKNPCPCPPLPTIELPTPIPSHLQRNNTTGYRGVSFDHSRQKYAAVVKIHGKGISLGRFTTAEQAARVRDRKELELRGDKAILNFPREDYE